MQKQLNQSLEPARFSQNSSGRRGNMLPFFIVLLPAMLGVLGLVIDGGVLRLKYRQTQNAADAAATAAADALADGQSVTFATNAAVDYVNNYNGLGSATVRVLIPPVDGPYAGQSGFAEVQISLPVSTLIIQVLGSSNTYSVKATAVAGSKASTAGAAIVVLDPNPPGIALPPIVGLTLPATPSPYLGGLEVLGIGDLNVNGAVIVDTTWGGFDQFGSPVGEPALLRAAATCMPLISLTSVAALNVRVTGGVDNPNNFVNYNSGQSTPLKANMSPVPDPLINLPVPSTSVDATNVSGTLKGGVSIVGIPLIGPPITLQPGVYDYIQIATGTVVFKSGVYVIRGTNPLTGIALSVLAAQVTANGVMFYITDSTGYNASNGSPDSSNNGSSPGPLTLAEIAPSVLLQVGLLGSQFSPLNTGSPYDGILIYQKQSDRRVIVISTDSLLPFSSFSGTIYAKWGHVLFTGMGTLDTRFVAGSVRFINIGNLTLQPSQLFPPAQDVFLVQ